MSWDIIGHEWAVSLLSGHIARGEVRHAYLFCGPPGVGRRTLALRFAQAINCTRPPAPGVPCRTCRDCRQIEALQHPDLIVVEKREDKTELIIDDIRALRWNIFLAPVQAGYRIGLLRKFNEASAEAQNALLKILEEAPSRAILLITCDTPEGVLPTVLSRCEVLRLRPLAPVELSRALPAAIKEKSAGSGEVLQAVPRYTWGRPGAALRLAQDPKALSEYEEFLHLGFDVFGMSRRERLALAASLFSTESKLNAQRERMRRALTVWASLWRDIFLCAGDAARLEPGGSPGSLESWPVDSPLINLAEADLIADIASQLGLDQARLQLERLSSTLEKLDPPFHVNPRLLAEVLLLDWPVV